MATTMLTYTLEMLSRKLQKKAAGMGLLDDGLRYISATAHGMSGGGFARNAKKAVSHIPVKQVALSADEIALRNALHSANKQTRASIAGRIGEMIPTPPKSRALVSVKVLPAPADSPTAMRIMQAAGLIGGGYGLSRILSGTPRERDNFDRMRDMYEDTTDYMSELFTPRQRTPMEYIENLFTPNKDIFDRSRDVYEDTADYVSDLFSRNE